MKLKDWLEKHGFVKIDYRWGLGVWENARGEKIYTDENFDVADYDLLQKTERDMRKYQTKGEFNVVCK